MPKGLLLEEDACVLGRSPKQSLSLCAFLCSRWATHTHTHTLFWLWLTADSAARDQSQAIGMKSFKWSITSFFYERAGREKSGADSLSVISTSGTESLIPSNLSLWSPFNAPSRWPESVVRIWETHSESKMMIRDSAWMHDESPQHYRLSFGEGH